MVFMLVYYRLAGANAVIALVLNLVILLAAFGLFRRRAYLARHRRSHPDDRHGRGFERADLERIREELRASKAPVPPWTSDSSAPF